jgi:chromosome segregation ATPase
MVAQVEWAKQPITEAMALADEITALKGKANLDPGQFKGLLTAAFKDGKVAVDAELGLDAETQAELEATLKKLKEIGPKLKEVPKRAKTAVGNVLKLAAKAPFLVGKAGRELKKQLKEAAADNKTEVQANITSLKDLPGQAKNQMGEIKTQLTSLPQEATRALTKLTASFAGNVSAS